MSKSPTAKVKLNVYCEKDKIYVEGTSEDITLKDMKLDITDLAIVAIMDSMEYQARKTGYCAYISGGRKIEFSKDGEVSE